MGIEYEKKNTMVDIFNVLLVFERIIEKLSILHLII